MARKLKTFVTRLGFFDLAVAAPSMKAAMEAWGIRHNAFHRGDAAESDDAAIVAATMAKPGTVLKRPVGTSEPFREDAALPAGFSLPVNAPKDRPQTKPTTKARKTKTAARNKKLPRAANANEDKSRQAAIISFEKARAERDRARAREDAAAKRDAEKRGQGIEKAHAALEGARHAHQDRRDKLTREFDRRLEEEEARWAKERRKLEAALDQARRS